MVLSDTLRTMNAAASAMIDSICCCNYANHNDFHYQQQYYHEHDHNNEGKTKLLRRRDEMVRAYQEDLDDLFREIVSEDLPLATMPMNRQQPPNSPNGICSLASHSFCSAKNSFSSALTKRFDNRYHQHPSVESLSSRKQSVRMQDYDDLTELRVYYNDFVSGEAAAANKRTRPFLETARDGGATTTTAAATFRRCPS